MFNEVFNKNKPRVAYKDIVSWANSLPYHTLIKKKNEAENLFKKIGITFSVYNNFDNAERLIPFDMFPRIITSLEWLKIQKGIKSQRQVNTKQKELQQQIEKKLKENIPNKILLVGEAIRKKISINKIHKFCKIDPWFLAQIKEIIENENKIKKNGLPKTFNEFNYIKSIGFSDKKLSELVLIKIKHPEKIEVFKKKSEVYEKLSELDIDKSKDLDD